MKSNLKILAWVLFFSAILLGLISNFFVQDVQAKALLLYISFAMGGAGFFQGILFLVKPKVFKEKTGKNNP